MTEREAFEDWYFKQNHLGIEPIDHARESYKAGSASRQAEIDALNFKLAEMKSRLNDAYTDGQTSMYKTKQSKIDELQSRIDEVVFDLQHIESAMWEEQVAHVLMILKGE